MYDLTELKGLQVKAELGKLADPSPAFASLLMLEESKLDGDAMTDSETIPGQKRSLGDLFGRIEKARPAVQRVSIDLSRKLANLQSQLQG